MVLAAACLLAPAVASAQPTTPDAVELKDPTTAFMLSFGSTAAGTGLFLLSVGRDGVGAKIATGVGAAVAIVGPSVGHIYAGRPLSTGLGVRIAGAGGMLTGIVTYMRGSCTAVGVDRCVDDTTRDAGTIVFATSAAVYLAGVAFEIATASEAAREHNRDHAFAMTVTPLETRSGIAPAIGFSGRF